MRRLGSLVKARLSMGLIALALVLRLRGLAFRDYLAGWDPVADAAYRLMLILFALMPLLVARNTSTHSRQQATPHHSQVLPKTGQWERASVLRRGWDRCVMKTFLAGLAIGLPVGMLLGALRREERSEMAERMREIWMEARRRAQEEVRGMQDNQDGPMYRITM
jgi:hypothetical protein